MKKIKIDDMPIYYIRAILLKLAKLQKLSSSQVQEIKNMNDSELKETYNQILKLKGNEKNV